MLSLKLRGSWCFSSNKYGYDYENIPYSGILFDLKEILNILIESKLFIPKTIDKDIPLIYDNMYELISIINTSGKINNTYLI